MAIKMATQGFIPRHVKQAGNCLFTQHGKKLSALGHLPPPYLHQA